MVEENEPGRATAAGDPVTRTLGLLLAGHRRYRDGRASTADPVDGPVAAVLGCADPQPALFGGLPLYEVRTAGLRVGPAVLGSVEYAVDRLRLPLVVVLGHLRCGVPGAGGPAHVRATLAALRRGSRVLDTAVADGRCALVGMCWHEDRDLVRPVLPRAVPAAHGRRLRPPSRRTVRAR
ncbi:carbonic anhydrase [Micromonospora auratinigra]|uniref:Carbonic anhydrase n=2 Tax=Micromonospora auratinigra TaxID=261654 RepID=A0A1A8Z7R6_9ACTN|nr:carbonic anhydrase [Micromonospora auratinigra]